MSSLDKEPITANRFVDYFDGIASFEVYDRGVNNAEKNIYQNKRLS